MPIEQADHNGKIRTIQFKRPVLVYSSVTIGDDVEWPLRCSREAIPHDSEKKEEKKKDVKVKESFGFR